MHSVTRPFSALPSRRAFTMVESLVALTLTIMAGAVVLLSVESSVHTTDIAVEETIAAGMARQLADEILGHRYKAASVSAYQYPMGPSTWEKQGTGRERYDDIDDYHGLTIDGAESLYGQPLGEGNGQGELRPEPFRVPGKFFAKWRQQVRVYYVSDSDPSVRLAEGRTSSHRAVEITIYRRTENGGLLKLAFVRRVCGYIAPPASS